MLDLFSNYYFEFKEKTKQKPKEKISRSNSKKLFPKSRKGRRKSVKSKSKGMSYSGSTSTLFKSNKSRDKKGRRVNRGSRLFFDLK